MKTLKAWEPYEFCLRCFYKLHNTDDINNFDDWDIYWVAAITAVRAVWHVLTAQDLKGSELKLSIRSEYNEGPAKYDILQVFVKNQRDRTIKKWNWDVITQDFMIGGSRGQPFVPTHKALVFEYLNSEQKEVDVDEKLQGEDPLRLLGIALNFLHRDLSKIEIALIRNVENPFSGGVSEQEYGESPFFENAPNYYR